jgi:hypothetical protein
MVILFLERLNALGRCLMEFYKPGVHAYIMKPVNFPDIMGVVEQRGVFWAVADETAADGRAEARVRDASGFPR